MKAIAKAIAKALTVLKKKHAHLPAVYHMSTYHPILSGIRTFKLRKREK